jgi:renalase
MPQVAIIGAGAAGLAAAQALTRHGITPTIYEKSRGVGGRMLTRRVFDCVVDHGAQNVKTPTPALEQLIRSSHDPDGAPAYNIRQPIWTFDAAGKIAEGDPEQNAEPKWGWPSGINRLSRMLAQGLTIRTETQVERLVATGTSPGYTLLDATGAVVCQADAVLLTPPGPQSAAIIAAGMLDQALQEQLLDELARADYRRCLSVALAYPRRPELPWYALVNTDRRHPIAWLAADHAKPGHAPAQVGLMLAQMSHDFSVAHWEAAAKGTYAGGDTPLPPMITEVQRLVQALLNCELGPPLWADLQRWRYALPAGSADFARLNHTGSGLFFAGDYVAGQGRVHLAIESGRQVAALIEQWVHHQQSRGA